MGVQHFDDEQYRREYLNYDVTNKPEIIGNITLLSFDLLLYFWIFENFRQICRQYYKGSLPDPRKMICINFNLLLSVIVRIFDNLYLLIGCIWSNFSEFDKSNVEYVYFNVVIHNFSQLMYVQLQNLTTVIAAKMWLGVISCKYDSVKWPTRLTFCWNFLTVSYISTLVSLFMIAIVNLVQNDISSAIMEIFIWAGTFTSAIAFGVGCWAVLQNFDGIAVISLKRHARKVRYLGIFMIFFQVLRVVFNVWQTADMNMLCSFKANRRLGKKDIPPLPDDSFNWSYFMTIYLWSCDFLPCMVMILLFSPQPRSRSRDFLLSSDQKVRSLDTVRDCSMSDI